MSQISAPHTHLRGADLKHTGTRLHQWAIAWLRQLSWKTVAVAVLTVAAVTFLLLALAEIGFDQLANAFVNSSPIFLILAFLASQFRFQALALALRGAMGKPLPRWRTTQLQYAIQLFALATPGDSARLLMTVDYAEKSVAKRSEAVGKAPLATVTGWVVDALVLAIPGVAVTTGAHGSSFTNELGDAWPLFAAMAGVLVVGVLAIAFVPKIRARVVPPLVSTLTETWRSPKSPRQVLEIFGGGLLERLAFSASVLLIVASLPGPGITFWEAPLVAGGAVAVGGIIPTPGGIGVSAGTTAALLVVVGVPEATALAAAILMRAFNIYLPALYGVEALRELRRAKLP